MQPNPIATNALPVSAGTQVCIVNVGTQSTASATDSGSVASNISGQSSISDSVAAAAGIYAPLSPLSKRRKPKNNIAKTNSSFVSRLITNEALGKRLTERKTDDVFAFVNVSRAFEWLDMSTSEKVYTKGGKELIQGDTACETPFYKSTSYVSRYKLVYSNKRPYRRHHRVLDRRYHLVRMFLPKIHAYQ